MFVKAPLSSFFMVLHFCFHRYLDKARNVLEHLFDANFRFSLSNSCAFTATLSSFEAYGFAKLSKILAIANSSARGAWTKQLRLRNNFYSILLFKSCLRFLSRTL